MVLPVLDIGPNFGQSYLLLMCYEVLIGMLKGILMLFASR